MFLHCVIKGGGQKENSIQCRSNEEKNRDVKYLKRKQNKMERTKKNPVVQVAKKNLQKSPSVVSEAFIKQKKLTKK